MQMSPSSAEGDLHITADVVLHFTAEAVLHFTAEGVRHFTAEDVPVHSTAEDVLHLLHSRRCRSYLHVHYCCLWHNTVADPPLSAPIIRSWQCASPVIVCGAENVASEAAFCAL